MNKLSRRANGDIFGIVPAGTIFPFAGDTAPAGWLICDGSTLSRADYPELYQSIGTAWGNGDGSNTFHLPDLRGRFLRGVDKDSTGTPTSPQPRDPDRDTRSPSNAGGNTGNNVGTLQDDAIRNIEGDFQLSNVGTTQIGFNGGTVGTGPFTPVNLNSNGPVADTSSGSYPRAKINFNASNVVPTGQDNRPKNVAVNYIIRTGTSI